MKAAVIDRYGTNETDLLYRINGKPLTTTVDPSSLRSSG